MLIYKNRPSKMNLFSFQEIFSENYAADPEIGFLTKSF